MDCEESFQHHNWKTKFCSVTSPKGGALICRWWALVKTHKLSLSFVIRSSSSTTPLFFYHFIWSWDKTILTIQMLVVSSKLVESSHATLFLKCKILDQEKDRHFHGRSQGFTQNVSYLWMFHFFEGMYYLEFSMTFLLPFQRPTWISNSSFSLVLDMPAVSWLWSMR